MWVSFGVWVWEAPALPPLKQSLLCAQPALFTLCAGNELFYCLLYLFSFSEGPLGRRGQAGPEGWRGLHHILPGEIKASGICNP